MFREDNTVWKVKNVPPVVLETWGNCAVIHKGIFFLQFTFQEFEQPKKLEHFCKRTARNPTEQPQIFYTHGN